MRRLLFSLACAVAFACAAPAPRAHAAGPALSVGGAHAVYALQIPDKKIEIDIDKNGIRAHTVRWYENPMWVAIGVLVLIIVLLLVTVAKRGSRTIGG